MIHHQSTWVKRFAGGAKHRWNNSETSWRPKNEWRPVTASMVVSLSFGAAKTQWNSWFVFWGTITVMDAPQHWHWSQNTTMVGWLVGWLVMVMLLNLFVVDFFWVQPRRLMQPLKNGAWKTILSCWVLVTFQGRTVKLGGVYLYGDVVEFVFFV